MSADLSKPFTEDQIQLQLAMFLQARDTKQHGSIVDNKPFPAWGDAGPVSQSEYLADARAAMAALEILGWGSLSAPAAEEIFPLAVFDQIRVSFSYGVNSGTAIGVNVESVVAHVERKTQGRINVDKIERRTMVVGEGQWVEVLKD